MNGRRILCTISSVTECKLNLKSIISHITIQTDTMARRRDGRARLPRIIIRHQNVEHFNYIDGTLTVERIEEQIIVAQNQTDFPQTGSNETLRRNRIYFFPIFIHPTRLQNSSKNHRGGRKTKSAQSESFPRTLRSGRSVKTRIIFCDNYVAVYGRFAQSLRRDFNGTELLLF